MKRLYIGAALLLAMLAIGIFLTVAFTAIHQPLEDLLHQAQAAATAENWKEAQALTEKAQKLWKKSRHFVAAVADHEPLENIDGLFARLEVLCDLEQVEEFAADCAQLSRLCQAMAQSQKLSWWNLL